LIHALYADGTAQFEPVIASALNTLVFRWMAHRQKSAEL
jgi:hypothetical protein